MSSSWDFFLNACREPSLFWIDRNQNQCESVSQSANVWYCNFSYVVKRIGFGRDILLKAVLKMRHCKKRIGDKSMVQLLSWMYWPSQKCVRLHVFSTRPGKLYFLFKKTSFFSLVNLIRMYKRVFELNVTAFCSSILHSIVLPFLYLLSDRIGKKPFFSNRSR